MGKKPRSFSIDEDLDEALSNREDLNPSGVVNDFLKQYLSAGKGREAALEVRLNQLDEEIADVRQDLDRLERERERVQEELKSRRSDLYEVLDRVEEKIEAGTFPAENVDVENPAIQKWASEANVSSQDFVDELEGRL